MNGHDHGRHDAPDRAEAGRSEHDDGAPCAGRGVTVRPSLGSQEFPGDQSQDGGYKDDEQKREPHRFLLSETNKSTHGDLAAAQFTTAGNRDADLPDIAADPHGQGGEVPL